jgi:hypothetical protein
MWPWLELDSFLGSPPLGLQHAKEWNYQSKYGPYADSCVLLALPQPSLVVNYNTKAKMPTGMDAP